MFDHDLADLWDLETLNQLIFIERLEKLESRSLDLDTSDEEDFPDATIVQAPSSSMPYTCCVTNCRGNYDKNNKVHIFGFPKDDELKKKWVTAIPRKDLIITTHTKVCEKHFSETDIEWTTTFYKESTGETLKAQLKIPKLKEGAVPSRFPPLTESTHNGPSVQIDHCKKRWKNIKDTHRKRQKKGDNTEVSVFNKKKKWPLADSLTFLNQVDKNRESISSIQSGSTINREESMSLETSRCPLTSSTKDIQIVEASQFPSTSFANDTRIIQTSRIPSTSSTKDIQIVETYQLPSTSFTNNTLSRETSQFPLDSSANNTPSRETSRFALGLSANNTLSRETSQFPLTSSTKDAQSQNVEDISIFGHTSKMPLENENILEKLLVSGCGETHSQGEAPDQTREISQFPSTSAKRDTKIQYQEKDIETKPRKRPLQTEILKLLGSRQTERDAMFKKLTAGKRADDDDVDLFFKSIARSVKKLRPDLINESKMKTLQMLIELENLNSCSSDFPNISSRSPNTNSLLTISSRSPSPSSVDSTTKVENDETPFFTSSHSTISSPSPPTVDNPIKVETDDSPFLRNSHLTILPSMPLEKTIKVEVDDPSFETNSHLTVSAPSPVDNTIKVEIELPPFLRRETYK